MLRKYSTHRSHTDNLKLGAFTAFSAGMVNVVSVIVFFSFTSNVTGHYAILAQEISRGNWYQASVVVIWIALFLFGNFTSNLFIIHGGNKSGRLLPHAAPLILEILCLFFVAFYLQNYYSESLNETEVLVGIMLFSMGLQNGLTASISNSVVKTTHLTGLTTDLGIFFSMLTKKEFRKDRKVIEKGQLLLTIMICYMIGGVFSGVIYYETKALTLYVVCLVLGLIILYDLSKLRIKNKAMRSKRLSLKEEFVVFSSKKKTKTEHEIFQ